MKHEPQSGRASRLLRPVLLAFASTAVWLALSATAASAETGAGADSSAGGLTWTFSTVSSPMPVPISSSPVVPPGAVLPGTGGSSPGLLPPVPGSLTGSVAQFVASVPVSQLVSANPVADLASPVAGLVDSAVAEPAGIVLPAASGPLPGAGAVLDPLDDALSGALSLPPAPPVTDPPPTSTGPDQADLLPAQDPAVDGGPIGAVDVAAGTATRVGLQLHMTQHPLPRPSAMTSPASPLQPNGELPGNGLSDAVPAGPGSGTGSGPAAAGPGAGFACETTAFELRPPLGRCQAGEPLHSAAPPVSFDPGSSPD
ncbi:hypothetical protein [Arthrobacter sp. UYEF3]|uniref:hypothetical protein n=1 Tax=Arthrobacter sp. UYEF3 TaxID=1756365 RepID=UPI0033927A3F